MEIADVIAPSACIAVGLKPRLKAAATKPTAVGWDGAINQSISINRAWGRSRATKPAYAG